MQEISRTCGNAAIPLAGCHLGSVDLVFCSHLGMHRLT